MVITIWSKCVQNVSKHDITFKLGWYYLSVIEKVREGKEISWLAQADRQKRKKVSSFSHEERFPSLPTLSSSRQVAWWCHVMVIKPDTSCRYNGIVVHSETMLFSGTDNKNNIREENWLPFPHSWAGRNNCILLLFFYCPHNKPSLHNPWMSFILAFDDDFVSSFYGSERRKMGKNDGIFQKSVFTTTKSDWLSVWRPNLKDRERNTFMSTTWRVGDLQLMI